MPPRDGDAAGGEPPRRRRPAATLARAPLRAARPASRRPTLPSPELEAGAPATAPGGRRATVTASPELPAARHAEVPRETSEDESSSASAIARYRVRGLAEEPALRAPEGERPRAPAASAFHVDTLELYSARQRAHFTKLAATSSGSRSG